MREHRRRDRHMPDAAATYPMSTASSTTSHGVDLSFFPSATLSSGNLSTVRFQSRTPTITSRTMPAKKPVYAVSVVRRPATRLSGASRRGLVGFAVVRLPYTERRCATASYSIHTASARARAWLDGNVEANAVTVVVVSVVRRHRADLHRGDGVRRRGRGVVICLLAVDDAQRDAVEEDDEGDGSGAAQCDEAAVEGRLE
ncbi:hypothetical protein QOZ80_1AG0024130 [Eleusine coracana subsp. coracana]|nr:hypothetical protein QOZ80_1AG0024130 [Eleusine coracana subsp. coracana]